MQTFHCPVMVREVMEFLSIRRGGTYVDMTVGGGGYAAMMLESIGAEGKLIGIDRDPEAIAFVRQRFKGCGNVVLVHDNFCNLKVILKDLGFEKIDGCVADAGVSSHQLDSGQRGFSFREDSGLDFRMDNTTGSTGADLVNTLPVVELERILREYGEERWARRIARCIEKARSKRAIRTTRELADIVAKAIPQKVHPRKIHPATRSFLALRIAVNNELEALHRGIRSAVDCIKPSGRIVVVTYHSLEDRLVKRLFLDLSARGSRKGLLILTKKPLSPSKEEVRQNRRARSAKLRAAEIIEEGTE